MVNVVRVLNWVSVAYFTKILPHNLSNRSQSTFQKYVVWSALKKFAISEITKLLCIEKLWSVTKHFFCIFYSWGSKRLSSTTGQFSSHIHQPARLHIAVNSRLWSPNQQPQQQRQSHRRRGGGRGRRGGETHLEAGAGTRGWWRSPTAVHTHSDETDKSTCLSNSSVDGYASLYNPTNSINSVYNDHNNNDYYNTATQ